MDEVTPLKLRSRRGVVFIIAVAMVGGNMYASQPAIEASARMASSSNASEVAMIGIDGYEWQENHPAQLAKRPDSATSFQDGEFTPELMRKLMRPSFDLATEWQAKTDNVGLASYNAGITLPAYPIFGPPPPFLNADFKYTAIDAPSATGLPSELYEFEFGIAWMRRINDRWMTRFMAGTSFATDGSNNSSDAWRFRGGAFALYRRNPRLTWTFGAIALGRNDLPVVPAVGVIYQPSPEIRFDLIMPRPRISFLLSDSGPRQQWGYIGAGLNGSTWGVERTDGVDDQLTYGDFRVVVGWESTPTAQLGVPFTRGRRFGIELGYVFSRDFEFENTDSKTQLGDAFMARCSTSF